MHKKTYESPELWLMLIEAQDVITSSPEGGVDFGDTDNGWERD